MNQPNLEYLKRDLSKLNYLLRIREDELRTIRYKRNALASTIEMLSNGR